MGRGAQGGARRRIRPPWGVDEPAGLGLGGARSESQRLTLGDTTRLDGLGGAIEPAPPPQYPGIEKRIQAVQERDMTMSRFTRRNLVWYDTELGNASGDKMHGSHLPTLSARASRAAALSTPPKPFWSDRSHKPFATASPRVPGYSGFRPRNDIQHSDPHRYKQPPSLIDRAAMTSVQRGVYGYRGYIPRELRDKAVALPIGHQSIESRQQQFMRTTECATPPP